MRFLRVSAAGSARPTLVHRKTGTMIAAAWRSLRQIGVGSGITGTSEAPGACRTPPPAGRAYTSIRPRAGAGLPCRAPPFPASVGEFPQLPVVNPAGDRPKFLWGGCRRVRHDRGNRPTGSSGGGTAADQPGSEPRGGGGKTRDCAYSGLAFARMYRRSGTSGIRSSRGLPGVGHESIGRRAVASTACWKETRS